MSSHPLPQLARRYYLEHFEEMVGFVEERYVHVLEKTHVRFLEEFRSLSRDARCLYVRIANRKGLIFRKDTLRYDEIEDLDAAVHVLEGSGFIRLPKESDLESILRWQSCTELTRWIRSSDSIPNLKNWGSARKQDLVAHLEKHLPFSELSHYLQPSFYLVQEREEELDYLLFLYFGRPEENLTVFALRDLGVVNRSRFRTDFEARFASREEALASFHYEKLLRLLKKPSPATVTALKAEVAAWPEAPDPESQGLRDRALHQLGRGLERLAEKEAALEVFLRSRQFPSTERATRLLVSLGREQEAETLLRELIDSPSCDEELLFAEDFLERKFGTRKVGRLTHLLRSSDTIVLDESMRGHPEAGAINHYAREGIEAFHVENILWRQLFGLLFWDLLFGEQAALHNDFDRKPRGLDSGEFLKRNQEEIRSRLKEIDETGTVLKRLDSTWEKWAHTPNAIVPWYEDLFAILRKLILLSPQGSLARVIEPMTRQFRTYRTGFPDLLLFIGEKVRFVEIKAEGDQIQRHQLAQIERLNEAGLPVSVVRAKWASDPDQEYVVVDVETTGGNPSWGRVTEIGAVRVRGREILEEWTSLINPHTRIPKRIVEITGITDDMVADAPSFEEIVDEFLEFVGNRVFVGHRVKFDYGFLRAECERAGRILHCPTLCTVVSMRRYFPGLPSYGLAKLSEHFAVSLENHHRALDDARATAKLLMMVNQKRAALLETDDPSAR